MAACDGVAQGAHEIESYCLGHKSFVSSAVFVEGEGGLVALATAGGDGSVRRSHPLQSLRSCALLDPMKPQS